jgi:protein-S-isoprenylcysteine O-methyltransferase Ste14
MKKKNWIDAIFLASPGFLGIIESLFLGVTVLLGWIFSWPKMPFFPVLNIIGSILFFVAIIFHIYFERTHKQAHDRSDKITGIVSTGIYAKIRHPLYATVIFMYIGIGLAFGVICTLILAVLFAVRIIITIHREEKFLIDKFPQDYNKYMMNVKWRLVPHLY